MVFLVSCLRYCACIKHYLRGISLKYIDKTYFKYAKIMGGGVSALIPMSNGQFNLTILQLKCNLSLIRICDLLLVYSDLANLFLQILFLIIHDGHNE